jgi:hypothetical protein
MRKKLGLLIVLAALAPTHAVSHASSASAPFSPAAGAICPKGTHLFVCPTHSFCCPDNAFCACLQ